MSELFTPLLDCGLVIAMIGLVFGGYLAFREASVPKYGSHIITLITGIGLLLIGVDMIETNIQWENEEKLVTNDIENMSCSQLHDSLLHNKINGTAHVQRATERYVAGCETK